MGGTVFHRSPDIAEPAAFDGKLIARCSDSSVTCKNSWTAGSIAPTGTVVGESPTQPPLMTPMSSLTMSPY